MDPEAENTVLGIMAGIALAVPLWACLLGLLGVWGRW